MQVLRLLLLVTSVVFGKWFKLIEKHVPKKSIISVEQSGSTAACQLHCDNNHKCVAIGLNTGELDVNRSDGYCFLIGTSNSVSSTTEGIDCFGDGCIKLHVAETVNV